MPRIRFLPSRHTLLLAVLMAALVGGAWWWVKPPPEPVYDGWPLSRWMQSEPDVTHRRLLSDDAFLSSGPAAVKWLAYKVEHGRHSDYRAQPSAMQRMWERLFHRRGYDGTDEDVAAAVLLGAIGPPAEAAIPTLTRVVVSENPRLLYRCASALNRIGPPSRETVRDLIARGSATVRSALIDTLLDRLDDPFATPFNDEADWVFQTIVEACHAPDSSMRSSGLVELSKLGIFFQKNPGLRPITPSMIRLIGDADREVSLAAAMTFRLPKSDHFLPVPVLVYFLKDDLPSNRIAAAETLATADQKEKQSADALLKLTHDPDPECREAAKRALRALGLAAPE